MDALLDAVSAIAKLLSVGWRTGAAVALAAGLVWLCRYCNVPQVGDMPQDWYQGVMLTGLLGFSIVTVQAVVLLCQGIAFIAYQVWRAIVALAFRKLKRIEALDNLRCASWQDKYCLLWIKEQGSQRFRAYPRHALLILSDGHLIEQQNGIGEGTYWRVPDHIWTALNDLDLPQGSAPMLRGGSPPWENPAFDRRYGCYIGR